MYLHPDLIFYLVLGSFSNLLLELSAVLNLFCCHSVLFSSIKTLNWPQSLLAYWLTIPLSSLVLNLSAILFDSLRWFFSKSLTYG